MTLRDTLVGRVVDGRYRVVRVLGSGGFGTVYEAVHEEMQRAVALKVLTPRHGDDNALRRSRELFKREAIITARLDHPNVVRVYDAGTDRELQVDFLVMQLLHGRDVAKMLSKGIPDLAVGLDLVGQAAAGLAAGHASGLIHRDIKPGNLFVSQRAAADLHLHVLDFGIARWAETDGSDTAMPTYPGPHTPSYASPEQLRGERLTAASDVYSLGLVALEVLGGHRGEGWTGADRREQVLQTLPDVVPRPIRSVLFRALDPAAASRFRSAGEFLEAFQAGREEVARPRVQTASSARRTERQNRGKRAGVAMAGTGVAAIVTYLVWLNAAGTPFRGHEPTPPGVAANSADTTAPRSLPPAPSPTTTSAIGARLVSPADTPTVEAPRPGEFALALPARVWDAVDAYLAPRSNLRLATWADASADSRAAMTEGRMQFPFALWRDLDADGDLDVALVFVSTTATNQWGWRDWPIVVFRAWPDGHFDDVGVTVVNGSCFDGMLYVAEARHVEYGCFEVAVGSFAWNGQGFSVATAMGD
jgi:serine/threonine protein kinase